MDAFATVAEAGTRMKRTFTDAEQPWIKSLLEDASDYLRSEVIGQHVFPTRQSTFTAYPTGGWVALPENFVISIDRITQNGETIPFKRFEDQARVDTHEPVDVTFTFGLAEAPPQLRSVTIALLSQVLTLVENELGLSVGGLSSIALDDFKIAFADAGEMTGLALPEAQKNSLRRTFGRGDAWVMETRS